MSPLESRTPTRTPKRTRDTRRPLTRSEIMKRVKQKNSGAEVSLRSALHAEGLRFRLHRRIESIAVDIVFSGAKVAVLVDGCLPRGASPSRCWSRARELSPRRLSGSSRTGSRMRCCLSG